MSRRWLGVPPMTAAATCSFCDQLSLGRSTARRRHGNYHRRHRISTRTPVRTRDPTGVLYMPVRTERLFPTWHEVLGDTAWMDISFGPAMPIPPSKADLAKAAVAERRAAREAARAERVPKVRVRLEKTTWSYECPNCGDRFLSEHHGAGFCGLRCRSEAEAVRYTRRKVAEYGDRDALPDDIAYAVKMKIAHALGGGYDQNARKLPPGVRQQVVDRDGGLCRTCGAPGEEVDHIDGPSPDLSNLRLLCKTCHHEVTDSRLLPISDEETAALRDALWVRAYAPEALLPSDRDDWDKSWRPWVLAHRKPSNPVTTQRLPGWSSGLGVLRRPVDCGSRFATDQRTMSGVKEADVEAAFVSWLIERGWDVTTNNADYTDVIAKRGAELLLAEVKGNTSSPGLDVDTGFGQLLRRMKPDLGDQVRYAVVVPESMVVAVSRVAPHVRKLLDMDIFLVSDLGGVRLLES